MLLTGVYSPIIFFMSSKICGVGCQADVVYLKTIIDFTAGVILLGADKSYIYHMNDYSKENNPIFFNIFGLCFILGLSTFYYFARGELNVFAILIGAVSGAFFSIFRAIAISDWDYKRFNFVTLVYYISLISSVPLLFKFKPSTMFLSGSVISIFIMAINFRLYLKVGVRDFKNKFCRLSDIKSFLYFYKYGISDYLLGIFISLPALLFIIKFKGLRFDAGPFVTNFGLIFLIATSLRYPVSSIMPLLLSEHTRYSSWFNSRGLLQQCGFVFLLWAVIMIFLFLAKELGLLKDYSLLRNNLYYVGMYLWLSIVTYLLQIYLLISRYKRIVILINIFVGMLVLLVVNLDIHYASFYIKALIMFEVVRLSPLIMMFGTKK